MFTFGIFLLIEKRSRREWKTEESKTLVPSSFFSREQEVVVKESPHSCLSPSFTSFYTWRTSWRRKTPLVSQKDIEGKIPSWRRGTRETTRIFATGERIVENKLFILFFALLFPCIWSRDRSIHLYTSQNFIPLISGLFCKSFYFSPSLSLSLLCKSCKNKMPWICCGCSFPPSETHLWSREKLREAEGMRDERETRTESMQQGMCNLQNQEI